MAADSPTSDVNLPGPPDGRWSGRWVLLAIFLAGLLLAGGNVWFQRRQTRHAARFWGQQTARTIAQSSDITLYLLGDPLDGVDETPANRPANRWLEAAGKRYPILATRDVSRLGGITHLRRALVLDHFYASTKPRPYQGPWRFALLFHRQGQEAVVLCDDTLRHVGRRDGMSLKVLLVEGRRSLLAAVLADILRRDAALRAKWRQVKKGDFQPQPTPPEVPPAGEEPGPGTLPVGTERSDSPADRR